MLNDNARFLADKVSCSLVAMSVGRKQPWSIVANCSQSCIDSGQIVHTHVSLAVVENKVARFLWVTVYNLVLA